MLVICFFVCFVSVFAGVFVCVRVRLCAHICMSVFLCVFPCTGMFVCVCVLMFLYVSLVCRWVYLTAGEGCRMMEFLSSLWFVSRVRSADDGSATAAYAL